MADFNGDGKSDIAVTTGSENDVAILLNTTKPTGWVSLSPTSLNFGNQTLGVTSAPQTVTLSNVGNAPLTITGIAAGGDFAQTDNCPASLTAGASCAISVAFTPAAVGAQNGTLTITDNAADSPHTVSLSGTGVAALVSLSTAKLKFGSQTPGTTSAPQTVTLTNSGNVTLDITAIAVSAGYAQTNNCDSSLPAGANCALSVTFTPTAAGTQTGSLTITDNAANSPQMVTLSGTGADFSLTPAPGSSTSATVTAGQTATYKLALAGTPGFAGTVALECSGAPSRATCTVAPSPLTLNGSTAASATVTIATTASSIAFREHGPYLDPPSLAVWAASHLAVPLQCPAGNVALTLLMLWALVAFTAVTANCARRSAATSAPAVADRRHSGAFFLAGTLLLVALGGMACGGGGGGVSNPGTPAGTYTLTITAAYTSGSTNLQHSTSLTLIVR